VRKKVKDELLTSLESIWLCWLFLRRNEEPPPEQKIEENSYQPAVKLALCR
jgi:hypothetical protein